jgi:hypothetical protein
MVDSTTDSRENCIKPKKYKLVISKSKEDFVERRCITCGKLLMKELAKSMRDPESIMIRCNKCKTDNLI